MNAALPSHRLASGGLIERQKPLGFTFDGKPYRGFAGDTLASALLANGVRLVGRSFKYHRPRGILSAGSEEPNALVELRQGALDGACGMIVPTEKAAPQSNPRIAARLRKSAPHAA